jgi:hypothetical protein
VVVPPCWQPTFISTGFLGAGAAAVVFSLSFGLQPTAKAPMEPAVMTLKKFLRFIIFLLLFFG